MQHTACAQVIAAAPDIDRAIGRIFLTRASASEFATAMTACASLPQQLLGVASIDAAAAAVADDSTALLAGASSELLRVSLRAGCDPEVCN